MWEDGPAPASVVYVADAWVRGLRNPLVPMGYTSLVSLKAARGERVQVTPCGGLLFRCWSTYATTDRASYTSLPGWYFALIYNAMEVVGAAPHVKCIEFDGRRSLIAGACCNRIA
jgi:hypothetical protein